MSDLAFTNDVSAAGKLRRNAGFTLLELLTVTSIVAVLMAIAIPSFKYVTSSNRASSEINGLLGDMQFARSEAIREGQNVTICATSNGTSCTGGGTTTWHHGWLVFSDTGVVGVIDGTDYVLKSQKSFSGTDTLRSDHSINTVTFSREGFAMSLPSAVTFTLHDAASNARFTRCLSLTIVGALSTQIGGATTAENAAC
jgi:type IV fimbrial biogenesis protein FimT